jgi:uncharacterized membrane protein (UPF0182 family)
LTVESEKETSKLGIFTFNSVIFWLLVVVLTGVVVALAAVWIDLQWSISIHVYSLKASLDWFQIVFYHNYVFVAGALFSLLLVNPRIGHSDLWRLIAAIRKGVSFEPRLETPSESTPARVSPQLPHGKLLWLPWQLVKWTVGFAVFVAGRGNLFFLGNAMNPIMMASMGIGSWSDTARIFTLPISSASGADLVSLMPSMEAEYRIIQLTVLALLTILAIRMTLRLLARFQTNTVAQWLRGFLLVIAVVAFSIMLGAPYWLMNVTTPFVYGATWTMFLVLVFAWAYIRVFGLEILEKRGSRTMVFRGIAVLLGAAMLIQLGFVAYFSLNWNNNYLEYEWYPQTQKQITVTRWAAGLDGIKAGSVLSLPTSNASTILGLVRQWDQQAASVTMTKEIGAYNWMGLASSEIVFLNNTEYWVSPTTSTFPSADWISKHLIYTHAARIMVINTHTGAEVSTEQAFSVDSEPLIYYGESPTTGSGGFGNNVYVHVPGYSEVENATYGGEPDYTLNGWQKTMWFTLSEGQWGFAFSAYPIDMLWNRNIFNRVGEILIPGLMMDPSAYLASDGKNVYYVVQIYIDYPLQSGFADSPYLRFFGIVLVNVYDGSMHGYTVSNIIGSNSSDFLTDYYSRYYSSWQEAPSWLEPQLRYPEQLLGTPDVQGQLDYDFYFHVNDPFVWKSGSQFYERPSENTVQYIPWAVGEQTYFVGMQLAHFKSASSKNLAGVYIAYGGDKLGQIDLYQNPSLSTTFIGPSAAENALTTNSEVRTQLTLLPNYRIGSYLLYSVAGHLDYFVAVYTNPGTAGVVTQLPFMTDIDPTTGDVGVGATAADAYYNLIGGGQPVQPSNDTQVLLDGIFSLASSMNYTVVNATTVNPNVWIQTDKVSLGTVGVNATLERVASFMQTYGPQSIASTLYLWSDSSGGMNLGAMQVLDSKVTELYYITVTA